MADHLETLRLPADYDEHTVMSAFLAIIDEHTRDLYVICGSCFISQFTIHLTVSLSSLSNLLAA